MLTVTKAYDKIVNERLNDLVASPFTFRSVVPGSLSPAGWQVAGKFYPSLSNALCAVAVASSKVTLWDCQRNRKFRVLTFNPEV